MIEALTAFSMTTLGRFAIYRHAQQLSGGNWKRRKVCELLKLLISADQHRIHREQVQEILWPDSTSEQAANSLGKTLYLLRRALEPELSIGKGGSSTCIALDHDTLRLVPESMQVDVDRFESTVKALQVRWHSYKLRNDHKQDLLLLKEFDQALDLYGGDYLPEDIYADWTQKRRVPDGRRVCSGHCLLFAGSPSSDQRVCLSRRSRLYGEGAGVNDRG